MNQPSSARCQMSSQSASSIFLQSGSWKLTATRGFSAIEVIIVITISTLVMIMLANMFVTFNTSYTYQNARINTSSSAALFLNELSDYSLQASQIVSSRTFSSATYTTGSTTVIFELPAIDSSGNVLASTYDYVVFFASSTNLYRIVDANAGSTRLDGTKLLSDVLSNVTLTYDNVTPSSATSIVVNVLTQAVVKGKTAQSHLRQTVYLRNR